MWFSNKQEAFSREDSFRDLLLTKTDVDFEVQQGMMAMLIRSLYRDFGGERCYSHNRIRDIEVSSVHMLPSDIDKLLKRVDAVFLDKNPRAFGMWHMAYVTRQMAITERFSNCPVGSVALLSGLLDPQKWGVNAHTMQKGPCGYFEEDSNTFVFLDWRCGSLLGKDVMYHGPSDEVQHLQRSGQQTRLINRPMTERHILVTALHSAPLENHDGFTSRTQYTMWALPGAKFNLREGLDINTPAMAVEPRDMPMEVVVTPSKSGRASVMPVIKHLASEINAMSTLYHLKPVHIQKYMNGRSTLDIDENAKLLYTAMFMEPTYVFSEPALNNALAEKGMQISRRAYDKTTKATNVDFLTYISTPEGKEVLVGNSRACLQSHSIGSVGSSGAKQGALLQLIHAMDELELPFDWIFALAEYCNGRLPRNMFVNKNTEINYHQASYTASSLLHQAFTWDMINKFSMVEALKFHEAVANNDNDYHFSYNRMRTSSAEVVAKFGEFKIARTRATITKALTKKDRIRAIELAKEDMIRKSKKVC